MKNRPLILVVDDDAEDRETIEYSFSKVNKNTNIKYLNSGLELLDYLTLSEPEHYPDLIILDYNMPEISGKETLEQIKNNPFISRIPVLIYSTTVTDTMRKELHSLKALFCMEKSTDVKKLIDQARYFLELL